MSTPGDPPALLAEALAALRATVAGTSYPLALPDAAEAGNARDFLVAQLDDYLLPRLAQPDAPLLAVVGGPTGAGKSTLVNSLAQAPVSPAGVLRPTTRTPVLVSHPTDTPWFRRSHLLPGLARTGTAAQDPGGLHLVTAPALTPGLALLDSPDIDSVVDSDRALAGKLFAAADLWLFVTSAARYADAVPFVSGVGEGGLAAGEAARFLYGAAIVLIVLFEPAGLAGLGRRFRRKGRDPGGGPGSGPGPDRPTSTPDSPSTAVPSARPAQGSTT